jgi:hypothetical protein
MALQVNSPAFGEAQTIPTGTGKISHRPDKASISRGISANRESSASVRTWSKRIGVIRNLNLGDAGEEAAFRESDRLNPQRPEAGR